MTTKISEAQSHSSDQEVLEPPPPTYQDALSYGLQENMAVTDDGRIEMNANSRMFRAMSQFIPDFDLDAAQVQNPLILDGPSRMPPEDQAPNSVNAPKQGANGWSVRLNIVIQIVGSRGDVQPFIALAAELKRWGHRVRLATHGAFEGFVTSSGIEFFPIGGDPADLMAYMVKNPGLIPSVKGLRDGEVQRKRKMVAEILDGCWRSCLEPDPRTKTPFVADAIIANPPSFGHIHCSQALGIPLHLMFTMPWSSTRAFPHPLANLKPSNHTSQQSRAMTNFISYSMVEWMTWQGVGDIVNDWRKSLDLEPVAMSEGPGLADTLRVPFTYCWSPALIAKPADWGPQIDVCGFFFRDMPSYNPPSELVSFLKQGSRPIYIGFGSIVIDDPDKTTAILVEAIEQAGVRAIISRGQQFWGDMVAAARAGPHPIPYRSLDSGKLAESIRFCLQLEAQIAAQNMSRTMARENGVERAVRSFHANLPLSSLPCDILSDKPAVFQYRYKNRHIKLSGVAGQVLLDHLRVGAKKLDLYSSFETTIDNPRWDPVTGAASAAMGTYYSMFASVANIVLRPARVYRSAKDSKAIATPSVEAVSVAELEGSQSRDEVQLMIPQGSLRRARSTGDMARDAELSTNGTQPEASSSTGKDKNANNIAASMALASASSVGDLLKNSSKGMLLDIPLAFAEGSRALPKLYGEQVRDYGTVTDWKSGLVVSGKSLVLGIGEGFADLAVKPVQGAMQSGVTGGLLSGLSPILAWGFIKVREA
ncbi:hypothetical protein FDECE_4575 [Fusarium decemcellulare]|nr:hypothetical protein FDECE_4575 [Fusarium decemcellulare]